MTPHPYYERGASVLTEVTRAHAAALALADEIRPHDTGVLAASVHRLAAEPCETFTGPYTCEDRWSGRTPDAHYLADQYCWPCRIRHALRQAGALPPASNQGRTPHTGPEVGRSSVRPRARARRRPWWLAMWPVIGQWMRDVLDGMRDPQTWLYLAGTVVVAACIVLSINSAR